MTYILMIVSMLIVGTGPVIFVHVAFQPYFEPKWRVIVGALCWSYLYGVVGAMTVSHPAEAVPLRVLGGLIYVGGGLALCEAALWAVRHRQRG